MNAIFGAEFLEDVRTSDHGCGCGDAVMTSVIYTYGDGEYLGDGYGGGGPVK